MPTNSVDGVVAVDYDPFAESPLARVVPATESQQEIWLAATLEPAASLAYNEAITLELRGSLDVDALRRSLQTLLDRHDALRGTMSAAGDQFCIAAQAQLPFVEQDLSALSESDRAVAIGDTLRRVVETEFVLSQCPLLRCELLRLDAIEHLLVLSTHHIVCDGWSFGVMVRDLAALYASELDGTQETLPPADSFADFAEAEAAHPQSAEFRADEMYWLGQFAQLPEPLELPLDRPRPRQRSFASRREDLTLDAALVSRIKRVGAGQGASLYATLLATFGVLLQRLGGQDDLVIGIPSAGQSGTDHQNMVGHAVNVLPLRLTLDPSAKFADALARVRSDLLDAFEHQRYTFGTLLKRLALSRDPGRMPLVAVLFNLDPGLDDDSLGFRGLAARFAGVPRSFENFELFINAVQVGGAVRLECQYNSDLFEQATIARWLEAYATLLHEVASDAARLLSALPLLSESDAEALRALQPPPTPFDRRRIESLVFDRAAADPDRVALQFGDQSWTYAELATRAKSIALAVRARGVGALALVGISLDRGPDMVAAILGVLASGAGYVPLDPAFPRERLEFMASDAGLALLLTQQKHAGTINMQSERMLVIDAPGALEAKGDASPAALTTAAGDIEAVAYVIYTSGSTGKPKGVRVPHRSVANFLSSMRREPGIDSSDRLLAVTTLSFDIAVLELFLPLISSATVLLASREETQDGRILAELIEKHQVSVMQATPSTWRMLIEAGWKGRPGFRALCGGEALPADLASDLLSRCFSLWNMYGPTETTVWSTCGQVESPEGGISIGRPIDNTSIWIVDVHGEPCPIGVPGEIAIGGEGVTLGYLDRPELTVDRFVPDRFSNSPHALLYRTGDRGRWRNDSRLEHMGRLDFQVKLRGFRIELGEIETNLARYPGIDRVVAMVREDRPGDQRLVVYLTAQAGAEVDDAALRAHLRTALPEYMVPQHFIRLDAIPLLPNGKINRALLPAPQNLTPENTREREAPRNDLERRIAKAMEETLALPAIGINDDFFSLGGHSLLAAQLTARLNREFGVTLSLRTLFDTPDVARLSAAISDLLGSGKAAVQVPISRRAEQTSAPLSLMQERLWLLEEMNPGRVAYNTPSAHRLRGPLNEVAFEKAFAEMVQRQPILRTSIGRRDGTAIQVVDDKINLTLFPAEDLSAVDADQREPVLMKRLQQLTDTPFDLTRAPLFSARMFKLSDLDHVLFFMPHHMIWDGWSFDLFYVELSELYSAQVEARQHRLAELTVTYGDFAVWHRNWLEGPQLQTQLEFWRKRLELTGKPKSLPTDRPRRAGMSGEGRTEWIRVGKDQTSALHSLARDADATLNMTLLALYFVLLHGMTGERDLVVGTPVRGRNDAELESVMGYFTNLVPLHIALVPGTSFVEFVRDVKKVVIDSFGSPDVPLEFLQRELKRVHGSDALLYQALFSFQDARQRSTDWSGLAHEQILLFQRGATEDLGLWFLESAGGMVGGVTYNADIFRADTARTLRERYLELMAKVIADPRQPLSALTRDNAAGQPGRPENSAMREATPGLQSTGNVVCLHQAFEAQADQTPQANVLRFGSWGTRYAELEQRANRIAHALRARGVRRGSAVALIADAGVNRVAALLGIFKAGGCCAPLDPGYPVPRLTSALVEMDVDVVIGEGATAAALAWPRERSLLLDADTTEIASAPTDRLEVNADDIEAHAVRISKTSTSGAMEHRSFSHGFIARKLAALRTGLGSGGDRLLGCAGPDSILSVVECLLAINHGKEFVLAGRDDVRDAEALVKLVSASKADTILASYDVLDMLFAALPAGNVLPLRAVCMGMKPSTLLADRIAAHSHGLWSCLLTDESIVATCGRVDSPEQGVHVGSPLEGVCLQIRDESGEALSVGAIGEVCITDKTGVPNGTSPPLQRTGFRGRWLASGFVEELGRLDRRLWVRGRAIEPVEIESILSGMNHVAQVVVQLRVDRTGAAQLVAYLVADEGSRLEVGDILARLAEKLPEHSIPAHIVVLERFPLLASGKIDMAALPAPAAVHASETDDDEPATPGERMLADVWKGLLRLPTIRASDNFFDLGGDSLLALTMVMQVEKATRVRLNLLKLANSNLRALATELPEEALAGDGRPASGLKRVLGLFGLGRKSQS